MIVWDSREAEERNARQLLVERVAKLAKARRDLRRFTVGAVVFGTLLVIAFAYAVYHPSISTAIAPIALAVSTYCMTWGMYWSSDTIRARTELVASAQDNRDRVFGTGQR